MRGLCTEGNLRFKIDWASLIFGKKCTIFPCLTLYYRTISKYKPQVRAGGGEGGLYLEGRFNGGFFCVTSLGGLYLERLIFGILRYATGVSWRNGPD